VGGSICCPGGSLRFPLRQRRARPLQAVRLAENPPTLQEWQTPLCLRPAPPAK
jgi:hypothetical protein